MSGSDQKPAPQDTRVIGKAGAPRPEAPANTDDIETFVVATTSAPLVARLTVIAGPGTGQHRGVHTGTSAIGRDTQSNRIVLDLGDSFVSRTGHAILVHDAHSGGFRLADGGKPNGVKVNGVRLTGECRLNFSDEIEIGQTLLKLERP